ncbi:MlaD family protein [Oleidesulfovibrio sp.]|uniref:MlaD family protein n=1 Tax=Oleidesulfovibrio sp. TaxID=2909707 RepID=UPI003A873AE8
MSQRKNTVVVGVFVIGALCLSILLLVLIGSGSFFSKKTQCVMFFEGSVKGLSVGSPVVFRGVKVGSVSSISIYTNPETLKFTIPVLVDFERNSLSLASVGVDSSSSSLEEILNVESELVLERLITKGLRARLDMQSFVTGQLVITLDFYPDKPVVLHPSAAVPEIPTISSALEEVTKTFEQLPLKELAARFLNTLDNIDRLVSNPQMQALPGEVYAFVNESRDAVAQATLLMRDTRKIVTPLAEETRKTVTSYGKLAENVDSRVVEVAASLNKVLARSEKAAEGLSAMTSPDAALVRDLRDTLRELAGAARSLRVWADYLERHPEALIRGKGDYRR